MAQKEYKTKHDWVGKVIHSELSKILKYDHTNRWYMHNQASVLENETHKLLWDFEIQRDHLISARWPELVIMFHQRIIKGIGGLGNKRTIGDHPNYYIFENIKKSPEDARRLAVTQIPEKDYQLRLVWKTLIMIIIIIMIIIDNTINNKMTITRKQNRKKDNSMGVLND